MFYTGNYVTCVRNLKCNLCKKTIVSMLPFRHEIIILDLTTNLTVKNFVNLEWIAVHKQRDYINYYKIKYMR